MEVVMFAEYSKLFHQGPAIELIARESQVSIDGVARLYTNELAKLEVGARIRGFLHIFALRKVREMLRQRGSGTWPLARADEGWNRWTGRAACSSQAAQRDARRFIHQPLPASIEQCQRRFTMLMPRLVREARAEIRPESIGRRYANTNVYVNGVTNTFS
jgi:hypothetical protein